jgi:hypothetical protein
VGDDGQPVIALTLLLAASFAVGQPATEVPAEVHARARALIDRALAGVEGRVELRLFRTRAEMVAAVRAVTRHVSDELTAFYHFRSRTIFAWMAPRPDAALFRDRLPGALVGALTHEAMHARGHLGAPCYDRWRPYRQEGRADADAVKFLRGSKLEGAGAWELLLRSRVARGKHLFLPVSEFRALDPSRLSTAQKATWYAQAFTEASEGEITSPAWVVWDGSAEPLAGGRYRLIAAERGRGLLIRSAPGPVDVEVTLLDVGEGSIELIFGFRSADDHARIVFRREGGVRAVWREGVRWRKDPLFPAPPLAPGKKTRLSLRRGVVRVDGEVVLYVQERPGKCGVGVLDAAAEFSVKPAS